MNVDLVTDPDRILSACREILTAPEPAMVAVAFWGRGAIEELGVHRSASGTRLIVNAESGCCHPEELRELLAMKNIKVRTLSRLHAKTYIGESRMVVGSANASSNGLGFQRTELSGWREACVVIEAADQVVAGSRWFESRWSEGIDLGEAVIKKAEAAWLAARASARSLSREVTDESGAPIQMELDGGGIYVVVTDEDTGIDGEEYRQRARASGLDAPNGNEFYEGWRTIPKSALLLSFGVGKKGKGLFPDKEWLTESTIRAIRMKDGAMAYPVVKATAADRARFRCKVTARALMPSVGQVIGELLEHPRLGTNLKRAVGAQYKRPTDWCIPLAAFLEFCRDNAISLPPTLA